MAVCPATLKPCIDDLCYGNGCMRREAYGVSLLTPCTGCGKLIAMDGSETDECECEPECPDDWEPEDD